MATFRIVGYKRLELDEAQKDLNRALDMRGLPKPFRSALETVSEVIEIKDIDEISAIFDEKGNRIFLENPDRKGEENGNNKVHNKV